MLIFPNLREAEKHTEMSNKTQPTKASVTGFLNAIEHKQRRADGKALLAMFKEITAEKPMMWGESIVGFGQYHYRYDSGREGDSLMTGFSPRKSNLALYVMDGFKERDALLAKLGKHKTSVACLYINKLADVDEKVFKNLDQEILYPYAKEVSQPTGLNKCHCTKSPSPSFPVR